MGAGPMKLSAGRKGVRYQPMAEINVTPMVDVMLVLLVIFMITAPLLTVGVPLDLPKTKAATLSEQTEPLVVSIKKDGKIFIQETETDLEALVPRLAVITENKPDTRIFVRADKGLTYGEVMKVMGSVAAAGFSRVALIADMPSPAPAPGKKPPPPPKPAAKGKPAKPAKPVVRPRQVVTVEGMNGMLMRFAKCCAPVHGDPVVGVITRGRGVSVHHRQCHNLARQYIHETRIVEVDWADPAGALRPVTLAISTQGSMKGLMESISFLEAEGTPITSGRIATRQGTYTQHLTLMVDDAKQLKRILQRLNAISGIRAERVLESA